MGDLCLRILLSLYAPEYNNKSFRVKNIKTEVATTKGNRIDLWIETEEELIIIENKIYHTANNPFDDYEKTALKEIKKISNEKGVNLELISILLGFKNYNKSFKSITHFECLRKLKAELVNYIDNNYVLFLNQYIETMLKKDTSSELYKMNKESADFVRNHIEEIEKLENYLNEVAEDKTDIDELRKSIKSTYSNYKDEIAKSDIKNISVTIAKAIKDKEDYHAEINGKAKKKERVILRKVSISSKTNIETEDQVNEYISRIESFLYADEIRFPITSTKGFTEAE